MTSALTPMLATSESSLPTGKEWVFEPKYDGIRILAFATSDSVRLLTRNGIDKAVQFPEIEAAVRALCRHARATLVLDGEIVALEGSELARFQSLQRRLHERDREVIAESRRESPATFVLFDVLVRNDTLLTGEPWEKRRKVLEQIMRFARRTALMKRSLRISEAVIGSSERLLARAVADGWEGLIAKRTDSTYDIGRRSRAWVKYKLEARQEFVVGGWTEPRNSRQHFGALLIGYWRDDTLVYAGHVGGGFSSTGLAEMYTRLKRLERTQSPFGHTPKTNERAHWAKPELVVEVKFNEWTTEGLLRQPIFMGVRNDKVASEVTRDKTAPSARATGVDDQLRSIRESGGDGEVQIDGTSLRVSNLDKVYFPKAKRTKGDLLSYYARVADLLLPHLKDRPLILRRYPDGINKPAFFQQKAPDDVPNGIRAEHVADKGKTAERRLIGGDLITLLYCAQLGSIDMNPWHSRQGSLDYADYCILDLDPGPRANFARVVEIAKVTRDVLDAFALHAAIKTSGASGLHVMLPLPAETTYESSLLLAQLLATEVSNAAPKYATVTRSVKARAPGQVYVDYLQNVQGKSVASVLSVRARAEASVSMPIDWSELTDDLDPRAFTIDFDVADTRARMDEYNAILSQPVDLSVVAATA